MASLAASLVRANRTEEAKSLFHDAGRTAQIAVGESLAAMLAEAGKDQELFAWADTIESGRLRGKLYFAGLRKLAETMVKHGQ